MKWLLIFIFVPYCLAEGGVEMKVNFVCLHDEDIRIPIHKEKTQ